MKCPKCGFISFDYLDRCKKCGEDLASHKQKLGIGTSRMVVGPAPTRQPPEVEPAPQTEAPLISVTWERSPKKDKRKKGSLLGALTGRKEPSEPPADEPNTPEPPKIETAEKDSTAPGAASYSEMPFASEPKGDPPGEPIDPSSSASDLVDRWLENIGKRGPGSEPPVPAEPTSPTTQPLDDATFARVAAEIAAIADDDGAIPKPPEIVRDGWTAEVVDGNVSRPDVRPSGWSEEILDELSATRENEPESTANLESESVVESRDGPMAEVDESVAVEVEGPVEDEPEPGIDQEPEEPEAHADDEPSGGFPAPIVVSVAALVDESVAVEVEEPVEDEPEPGIDQEPEEPEITDAADAEPEWPGAGLVEPDAELPPRSAEEEPEPRFVLADDTLVAVADALPTSRGPLGTGVATEVGGENESENQDDEPIEYVEEVVAKAGLLRRGIALALDVILLAATVGLFLAVGGLITGVASETDGVFATAVRLVRGQLAPTLVLSLVLSAVYFTLFHGGAGQTPGKMCVGIRVVDAEGKRLGYPRAFLRYVAWLYSGAMFFLGFVWAAFDFNKQAWHDKLAHSCVVPVGEESF